MPFCPKCRYEYKPGITICPDCERPLVDELPPEEDEAEGQAEDMEQYEDWIQLARLNSRQHAEMIEDILRQKGIPAFVYSGTGHFGVTGQLGISSYPAIGGGYSIMVPAEYVVDADAEAEIILGEEWKNARLVDINDFLREEEN
jgi:hypothetical protein